MRAQSFRITAALIFLASLSTPSSGQEKKDGAPPPATPPAGGSGDKVPPKDDEPRGPSAENLLRKAEEHAARELAAKDADRTPLRDRLRGMAPSPVGPDDGYYAGPYGWYAPWGRLPPTAWSKNYAPAITHTPRLGLQYTYPFAYQMGIHTPYDADPLTTEPNLAPFVGVVGSAKAELQEAARAAAKAAQDPDDGSEAVALIKAGKYKEAGRLLAAHFQATEDPHDALLLSEVFFALGKPSHSEMLLRHGLESDGAVDVLPRDISKHFSSPEEFEKRLQDLDSAGETPLLVGYLKVHSKNPDAGLEVLNKLVKANPKDGAAALLYRHYLGKAFQE